MPSSLRHPIGWRVCRCFEQQGSYFLTKSAIVQRIPNWWSWYYYLNPVAWSVYGLATSQMGDDYTTSIFVYGFSSSGVAGIEDVWTADFVNEFFGYSYDFLPKLIPIMLAFIVAFWAVATMGLRTLQFVRR